MLMNVIKCGNRKKVCTHEKHIISMLFLMMIFLFLLTGCGKQSEASVVKLTTNYKTNPLSIESAPLFSWQMDSQKQGATQTAYRILLADSADSINKGPYLWDSGKVDSDQSVAVPYDGPELASGSEFFWKVQVWDQDKRALEFSDIASFGTALSESDWQGAKWISAPTVDKYANDDIFQGVISYITYAENSCTGFFFGATDSYYGDYYRVVLDTLDEQALVRVSEMHYETVVAESVFETIAEDYVFYPDQAHRFFISVCQGEIEIAIDHKPLGSHKIQGSLLPLGDYGFWTTRGSYYGYFDDLEIYNGKPLEGDLSQMEISGTPDIEEHFDNPESTIFSPYKCKMQNIGIGEDDWFVAESGFTITPASMEPAPIFYKEFSTSAKLKSARLYASAFGTYDIYLNGEPISDAYYAPGQSDYADEVFYGSYDVTGLLANDNKSATHTFWATLGHGRYDRAKSEWGDDLGFIALLKLEYEGGSFEYVTTDDSFLCYSDGPVRNDDMYAGEVYDARKEIEDFGKDWPHAVYMDFQGKQKEPAKTPMISPFDVCIEEIVPASITEPIPGTYVCDFGTNVSGFCELTGNGTEGKPVILRYAESINEENLANADDIPGTVWTRGLFTARNTDYYIPASDDSFIYAPRFVYRGFRYVQITGLSKAPTAQEIKALVISSDNERTGFFSCSNEATNALYEAIYRTQLNNYVDIPTDCPQRDERFGWAGDAQVFAHTADYNANTYSFMKEYLRTLISEQEDSGAFPDLTSSYGGGGSNGWADSGIILTYELYEQFADPTIIKENLEPMCKYMDYLVDSSEDYVRYLDSYSDHLAESIMSDEMCNTLQCAYVADLLSRMCSVVKEDELAAKYQAIFESYKQAWQTHFMNEDGTVGSWMQAEYVLPLAFRLYPEGLDVSGANFLNISAQSSEYHVQTGYVSTPWLLPVLCDYGYVDTAYAMLMQDTFPSWNYMLSHGNTTMTEAFHAFRDYDDGTYSIGNSLDHYALGSVGQWLYSDVLGIDRDLEAPGYKHFYLQPQINAALDYAEGSFESIYGKIAVRWEIDTSGKVTYNCTVPANSSATLKLPFEGFEVKELTAGTYSFEGTLKTE